MLLSALSMHSWKQLSTDMITLRNPWFLQTILLSSQLAPATPTTSSSSLVKDTRNSSEQSLARDMLISRLSTISRRVQFQREQLQSHLKIPSTIHSSSRLSRTSEFGIDCNGDRCHAVLILLNGSGNELFFNNWSHKELCLG